MDNYASLGAVCQEFKSKYDVLQTKTELRTYNKDKDGNYSSLETEYVESKPQYEVIGSKYIKELPIGKIEKIKNDTTIIEQNASPEYEDVDNTNDLKPNTRDVDKNNSLEKQYFHLKIERRTCIALGIVLPLVVVSAIAGGLAYNFTSVTKSECTKPSTASFANLHTTTSLVSLKSSVDTSAIPTVTTRTTHSERFTEIVTTEEPDVSTTQPETTTVACALNCSNGGTCAEDTRSWAGGVRCFCVKGFYGKTCELVTDGTFMLSDGILRNVARSAEGGTCTKVRNGDECNILINGMVNSYGFPWPVFRWYPSDILEFGFSQRGSDRLELVIYQDYPLNIKDILVTINGVNHITFQLEEEDATGRPFSSSLELYFPNATKARVQLLTMHGEATYANLVEIQFLTKQMNPGYYDKRINVAGKLYGGKVYSSSLMNNPVSVLIDDNTRSVSNFYWEPSYTPVKIATVRFDFHAASRIRQVRLFYGSQSVPVLISFDGIRFQEHVLPSIGVEESYDISYRRDTISKYMILVFKNSPLALSEVMVYGLHLYY